MVKRESESGSSSDYSDSSDDELPEPSPLPNQRPHSVEAATRYDTIKAVWSPRNKHPKADSIRNSMASFSDLIWSIRDTWKTRSEALKAAENQNQEDKIPSIKKDVLQQRRLLDVVINATLEYGHPAFVQRYVYFISLCVLLFCSPFALTVERHRREFNWDLPLCNHTSFFFTAPIIIRSTKQDESNPPPTTFVRGRTVVLQLYVGPRRLGVGVWHKGQSSDGYIPLSMDFLSKYRF